MKMIEKIIRAMQDTGLIDGMSMEDCDTLATAALEGIREPSEKMISAFNKASWSKVKDISSPAPIEHPDDGGGPVGYGFRAMIDAALNE